MRHVAGSIPALVPMKVEHDVILYRGDFRISKEEAERIDMAAEKAKEKRAKRERVIAAKEALVEECLRHIRSAPDIEKKSDYIAESLELAKKLQMVDQELE